MECHEGKINLTYLNGTGYVFNAKDYIKLRIDHRVIGSMVGTSCLRGRPANSCNVPIELTTYETQLLVEKRIAILLSKFVSLLKEPTQEDLQLYKNETETRLRDQEEHWKEGKVKESLHYINKIMYGKRKKLLDTGIPDKDIRLSQEEVVEEIRQNVSFDMKNAAVETCCEHPKTHEGVLVNPTCDNSLKYRVYKDFWERGKYITCGEIFGADFIIYPGDPAVFHASHIVVVLKENVINPLELITKVRLSVIVNKLCILAYADKDNELSYQTVKWENS